jgi:hypothetical protein
MAQNILWMQQAREKMFFFAMMLFAVGIWLSLPMFIRKSDLTPITGKLDTAYLNIATVSSTRERYGVSNTSYSQKATLTFRIRGYEQIYSIEKNIGDRSDDETYDQILHRLEDANLVSVWIKKKDSLETNPDVWQIYSDETSLLPLKAAKEKDLPIVVFLFFLGGLSVALIFWTKRRENHKHSSSDNNGE